MEKLLQNFNFKDRLGLKVFLFLTTILLFNIQNVFGQATQCASPIVYFLKTEGTSTDAALDGKIKLYGDVTGTNKVVVSTTALAAPTNNTEFTNAALFSSFANGYIKTNASNSNQTYYVRVYSVDGLCYTDNTVNFEKTNFTSVPTQPDIQVAVSHNGGAFVAKNTAFTAVVTVQNDGTATATGLEVTVTIPAGLTVGTPTASVGTYNAVTGKWTIPSVAPGSTNNATLTFANTQSTTEGIKFISANLTAEAQTDKDSSPTTNNAGEDDQDVACVSTPYELCNGNKIDITLASYTGIVWKKDGVTITGSVAGQYTLNPNGSLTIFSIGEYTYNITSGPNACPTGGCCPIKVVAAPLPVLSLTPTSVSCFGGNDGTITATATSGTTPYEFSKNGTAFQSSGVFNTLTAGTYTITAKDFQGCTATATTTVTQPVAALAVGISPATPAICNGQSVNLNATATGGTAPYTYTWSAGLGTGASKTVSPTATTLYTVSVTDGKNCAATATVNVTVNPLPVITAANATICSGTAPSVAISSSVASTYSWTVGTITGGITGASAGTGATIGQVLTNPSSTVSGSVQYIITATAATGGCTTTASVLVTVNPLPVITASNATICSGTAPSVGISSSVASTYSWTVGTITGGITGASAGTGANISQVLTNPSSTVSGSVQYIITATAATGGCTTTASVLVTVNPLPVITASNATICSGTSPSVAISSSVSSTYSWTVGTITGGITGASAGTGATIGQVLTNPSSTVSGSVQYIITATAATGGCTTTASVLVTVNPKPTVTLSNQTVCQNTSLTLVPTVTNGSGFLWSTGATSSTLVVPTTTAGTVNYTVTVTGTPGGCTATASASVTVNPLPVITAANATICSGTAPSVGISSSVASTYSWTVGTITGGITGASAGTGATIGQVLTNPSSTVSGSVQYIITATAATGGCTTTASVLVTVNPLPVITASNATICSGTAPSVGISSSVASTYSWTVGTITGGITGASAGTGANISQVLTNPSSTVSGSVQYIITATAATGGCTTTASVLVTVNPLPVITAANATICSGTAPSVGISSSVASTYSWTVGTITGGITGASAGTGANISQVLTNPSSTVSGSVQYIITATAATGGCTTTASVLVTVNPKPTVTLSNQTVCQNTSLTLVPTVTNGSGFLWSTGATSSTLVVPTTTAGTVNYTVTVTGTPGGCTATASASVTVNPLPVITAANATICSGTAPSVGISSSVASTYSWTVGTITGGITGASAGTGATIGQVLTNPSSTVSGSVQYIITATAAIGGCTTTASVLVTVNPLPVITAANATICSGTAPSVGISSSVASTYSWTVGTITGGITGASAGTGATIGQVLTNPSSTVSGSVQYIITATAATGGCTTTASVLVTVNPKPVITAANATICSGTAPSVAISSSVSSTYSWTVGTITGGITGASAGTGANIAQVLTNTNTVAGSVQYIITATAATGGCTTTATVLVTVNPLPTATLVAPAVCAGATTVLAPTGLSNAATFLWSTGATTSSISVNPTVPTGYTLTVTSASNPACSVTRTVWLDVKALPTAEVTVIPASCIGSVAQGNGQLMLNKYRDSDQVAYGSPISVTPTFANVPAGGIFATGLPNTATTYTIRLKNTITNCTNDLTALMPVTACPCPAGYCEPATVVKTK